MDDDAKNNRSTREALLMAAEAAYPFRSPDGRCYVQVPVRERHEVLPLQSRAFRDWLLYRCQIEYGQIPGRFDVNQVVGSLEDRARCDDQSEPVFVRVGRHSNEHAAGTWDYYLDLANPSGQAVKITTDGWSIVQRAPVHFRRPGRILPLPTPDASGSIRLLREYVNLSDPDFCLFIGWLAAAFMPVGPYPILVLQGEPGAAKSTRTRIARLLIDPHDPPLLAAPESTRDLVATAHLGWLLALDHVSRVGSRLADALCRLATGDGYSSRPVSGNTRDVVYAQRPVILNGINDFPERAEHNDHCLRLKLAPITPRSRRTEQEFWRSFGADYPAIFGGMLNAIMGGLLLLPLLHPTRRPRINPCG